MKFWSIERVVTILTPVFGAVAAAGTGWLGKHFPGLPALSAGDVTALELAGFTGAAGAALKWLHGRQQFTALEADAEKARAELVKVRQEIAADPQAGPALSHIEDLLRAHEGQIEASIDKHVPAAVGQALTRLFSQLGAGASGPAAVGDVRPAAQTTLAGQAVAAQAGPAVTAP